MDTSGGADAAYGGDVFQILDPVNGNEYIRLVTKGTCSGTTCSWTSVHRGLFGTTAVAHPANTIIRCACESDEQPSSAAAFYWDYIDDPHGTDTTQTLLVNIPYTIGHGATREPYILNSTDIYCQGGCASPSGTFTPSTLTGLPTLVDALKLTFNGVSTDSPGSSFQGYGTWDFQNASFKKSFIISLYFGGSTLFGTFSNVTGHIWQYNGVSSDLTFSPVLPYIGMQGVNRLVDISGPSSLLPNTGSREICIATLANECWANSSAGNIYADLPSIDSGVTGCWSGGEVQPYEGNDWCMVNPAFHAVAITQIGAQMAGNLGNDGRGVPQSDAGLSRRLVQTLFGPWRLAQAHMHTVTDGSYTIFESCAADPHLLQNLGGYQNLDVYGCQILMAQIPPQPPADGIDRTNFENITVTVGAGSGGATHARVKFGYRENEKQSVTGGVSQPVAGSTMHFYCTQYQGACYYQLGNFSNTVAANATSLSLSSLQTLQIGVPQRVLLYQVEYLNGSNQVVATDPMQIAAIP
jgi:hypothetical protein